MCFATVDAVVAIIARSKDTPLVIKYSSYDAPVFGRSRPSGCGEYRFGLVELLPAHSAWFHAKFKQGVFIAVWATCARWRCSARPGRPRPRR